jgi:hypothetical protein
MQSYGEVVPVLTWIPAWRINKPTPSIGLVDTLRVQGTCRSWIVSIALPDASTLVMTASHWPDWHRPRSRSF